MRDTVRFTVHGNSHRDLCDEADRVVNRLLYGEAGEPLPTTRWRVVESAMEISVAQRTTEGEIVLYVADVTTVIAPPEPFSWEEMSSRHQLMRVTLMDDYGVPLFIANFRAGETSEYEILPARSTVPTRLVISP